LITRQPTKADALFNREATCLKLRPGRLCSPETVQSIPIHPRQALLRRRPSDADVSFARQQRRSHGEQRATM
jgi:hypothetical protein